MRALILAACLLAIGCDVEPAFDPKSTIGKTIRDVYVDDDGMIFYFTDGSEMTIANQ